MRVIIKNADFSAVSIGKVIEDLSFKIDTNNVTSKFVNWNGTSSSSIQYYVINNGELGTTENGNRIRTDYIKVVPGMDILLNNCTNTQSVPTIVCFNSNKHPLGVSSCYITDTTVANAHYTIPQGTAYIWIQIQALYLTTSAFLIMGTMPEE